MGLFRKLEYRALMLNGSRTSIAIEHQFWAAADKLSKAQGVGWQAWAAHNLTKPHKTSHYRQQSIRASELRVAILEAALG